MRSSYIYFTKNLVFRQMCVCDWGLKIATISKILGTPLHTAPPTHTHYTQPPTPTPTQSGHITANVVKVRNAWERVNKQHYYCLDHIAGNFRSQIFVVEQYLVSQFVHGYYFRGCLHSGKGSQWLLALHSWVKYSCSGIQSQKCCSLQNYPLYGALE